MHEVVVCRSSVAYVLRMTLRQTLLVLAFPLVVLADSSQAVETPRFTLFFPGPVGNVVVEREELRGTSKTKHQRVVKSTSQRVRTSGAHQPLTQRNLHPVGKRSVGPTNVLPQRGQTFDAVARSALHVLNATYEHMSETFDIEPQGKVVLRFLSPKDFHRETQAPAWTSAMFLRGEITIPISSPQHVNLKELTRAIRHEYVHAVIAEISSKGCPAWIDEGIAQLFEGEPNPLLAPALRKWISENEALPLSWLENGFLALSKDLVPVAYAQSLFATRQLVRAHGFRAFQRYFSELRRGERPADAFETAFGETEHEFQARLTGLIKNWAHSESDHP